MPAPSAPTANTVILQTGNGNNLISWPIISGATSYKVQRSTDGVNFSALATPALNQYLDTTGTVGTAYYYQVAASNGSGDSAYTPSYPASIVPCLPGQINLGMMRYQAQLKCDQLNSNFLTLDEWNINLNKSQFELFDILTRKDGENYVLASPYTISTTGVKNYPLPDGSAAFAVNGVTPPAVYKLLGIDCGVAVGNNAWVTLPRYNWIDRNKFIYPQLQANALGVFNLSYRQMGNSLYFIPNPSAGQFIQVWYVPIMTMLLQDADMLSFSISGWDEYVIIDAAIKAATKREDYELVMQLKQDKAAILERIESTAANRDQSIPNTISDTRTNTGFYDGGGFGGTGHGQAGWLIALFPMGSAHNIGNHLLRHFESLRQFNLGYVAAFMALAYLSHKFPSQFGRWIPLARARHLIASRISALAHHVGMIVGLSAQKHMGRSHTLRIIAAMAAMKRWINPSMRQFVRKSMRAGGFSDSYGSAPNIPANSSISLGIKISEPNPARFRFFDSLPKIIRRGFGHARSCIQRAISSQGAK